MYIADGFKNHKNIVGACALMSNKTRVTYAKMLTETQQLTRNGMPHSLMADFE